MKKRRKDILVYIETEVQFDSIKPLLVHLRDNTNISFDIIVPGAVRDDTNIDVYNGGADAVRRSGFKVIRTKDSASIPDVISSTTYKVQLSAYVYHWQYSKINAKYRIMFPYASYYFNKPHWTIGNFINQDYLADALLSHAVGTKPVTDIFTKTYIVPSLKLMRYKKSPVSKKDKPVLFFAPTYNEIDFALGFLKNIDDIKKKFTVIMRAHHRVDHIKNNSELSLRLYEKADKVYSVEEYSIVEPLKKADVVISDNSAVIFDAIYCGIPVALFSKDTNMFRYKDINTSQHHLVASGTVLWTDNPANILNILDKTMNRKMVRTQGQMQERLFPTKDTIDPVGDWLSVIQIYLDDRLPEEYYFAKKYWIDHISSGVVSVTKNQELRNENNKLVTMVEDCQKKIKIEQSPGIRVATKRLIKAYSYKLGLMKRGQQ